MAKQTYQAPDNSTGSADQQARYSDGDIAIFDYVSDLMQLQPLNPLTNLIVLGCSGTMRLSISGKQVEVRPGSILLCPLNVKLDQVDCSDDFECKVLCLSDHIVQRLLRDRIDVWHRAVYVNQTNIIRMSDACKEDFHFYYVLIRSKIGGNGTPAAPGEIIQTLIRGLLLELCFILENLSDAMPEKKVSQGKQLFNKYLNMISKNEVKRRPIAEYASKLAITPKYLTMLCLKYSNKTASDWVIQYTLEDIRFYLRNTGLSIKEISAKLGFANMSHFGSYVRKHLGISPSAYRDHVIHETE